MKQLLNEIPDPDVFLSLEPEELGAKLLFLIRKRVGDSQFHPHNLIGELYAYPNQETYPSSYKTDIELASMEAWSWLEAQGLIVPVPDSNGRNGWRVLSRRAKRFEDEADFSGFAKAKLLPKEILHNSISKEVWLAFVRGNYDTAVFEAFKRLEISVRKACGYDSNDLGVALMRKAFNVDKGPLTDSKAVKPEREALQHLFAGAIGSFKNPHSHRDVNLSNPEEAIELVMLASHLLRIVDARSTTLKSGSNK